MEFSKLHAFAILQPGKNPGIHWTGCLVDPRAHLDFLQKIWLPWPCWIRTLVEPWLIQPIACSLLGIDTFTTNF